MNFAKFLRTRFLQNNSVGLILHWGRIKTYTFLPMWYVYVPLFWLVNCNLKGNTGFPEKCAMLIAIKNLLICNVYYIKVIVFQITWWFREFLQKTLLHELEPKKIGTWLQRVDKIQYRFLLTSGCLLSRKVWWALWIGSFWPKIEVFYRPEWTKGGTTWKRILSFFKFRNEYH